MIHTTIHMLGHLVLPLLVAGLVSRSPGSFGFVRIALLMLAGMVIDIDHLLATPVFDPGRCSIGFHPLHSWPAIAVYVTTGTALIVSALQHPVVLAVKWFIVGIGLHLVIDAIDCQFM